LTNRFALIVSLCLMFTNGISLNCMAQELHNPFKRYYGNPKLIYGMDNRRSHIFGQSVSIFGLYAGAGFDQKRVRLKIGLNASELIADNVSNISLSTSRMMFISIGEELDLFTWERFVVSTYINAGYGFLFQQTTSTFPGSMRMENGTLLLPVEPGLILNYKIYPWLRARTGGGWRYVLPMNNSYLNNYFIKIGLQVQFDELKEFLKQRSAEKQDSAKPE
jgi:hypothetical protein